MVETLAQQAASIPGTPAAGHSKHSTVSFKATSQQQQQQVQFSTGSQFSHPDETAHTRFADLLLCTLFLCPNLNPGEEDSMRQALEKALRVWPCVGIVPLMVSNLHFVDLM